MLTSKKQVRKRKQRKIRNSEYYDMEKIFDDLYAQGKTDKVFNQLMEIIESEENIKLAYRNIKRNSGSSTAGVDHRTIDNLAKLSEEAYVRLIRKQFSNYHPRPVRRVEIEKDNGKKRPLGIPTIVDRMVQQCILQVMEPICEAKFSENSNGFRPNRSAETAIAQCMRLIQVQHMYYVVDLDIKGFFDNINHRKLLRQIWALGIRDKKLICIIKEMLKAPVILPDGKRIYPEKGTPQGGILSPLLANIVLNELDWWIASQWEQMPTKTKFKTRENTQGTEIKSHAYRALRRSNLKEVHAVRYADDFKIFCTSHVDAVKAYKATELWLKDRLGLDISPEKSKVVNLKRQYSEFLRLDSLYDVIVELEEKIEDARLRRDAIKQQAITLENIYKIMVNFDCVYNIINDEEKRNVVTALIKEIEIYRNDESEYPLKRIGLNFPVFKDGGEVTELLWDKGNTVETICQLVKVEKNI